MNLTGVFPPIITPFNVNGEVDEIAFGRNLERWNSTAFAGYVVLGSNSEAVFLSNAEKLRLVEITASKAAAGRTVVAGSGMESARESLRLTNDAASAGAHAALILTPFYYGDQMSDEALVFFFSAIADGSKIPILIYNVPKFTHLNIPLKVLQRLSGHPNIIGMKDSSGNVAQLGYFRAELDNDFSIMVGTAAAWFPGLELGLKGGIMALANCCPGECVDIQKLYDAGKKEEALALYQRLLPVNGAVTATYGIAGLKYACELLGFDGGFVRNPLQPLGDSQKATVRSILNVAELI